MISSSVNDVIVALSKEWKGTVRYLLNRGNHKTVAINTRDISIAST